MKMSRTLRTALRALGRNKTRALLTTLGIIIGVGAVIAMMEIGRGSSSSIQRTIASRMTSHFRRDHMPRPVRVSDANRTRPRAMAFHDC